MNILKQASRPLFTSLCRTAQLTLGSSCQLLGQSGGISAVLRSWSSFSRSVVCRPVMQHSLLTSAFRRSPPTNSLALMSTQPASSVRPMVIPSFESDLTSYLKRLHRDGPPIKQRKRKSATDGRPFLKGVVLKTLIRKPKKPNSANRKCVRVRLSTGREAVAYIPGIGHNLQEHHIVLVRGGRVQDLPGVKLKCIRGKYDLAHVKKVTS